MKKILITIAILLAILLIAIIAFLYRPVASKSVAADGETVDVVLIGGGIMSATLGTYLTELEPNWQVRMFERLDKVAQESSNGLNNAGTGHSGFMEMNYTAEAKDGSISIERAEKIAATRMDIGTDVNYGAITTQLVDHLSKNQNFKLSTQSEVTGISRNDDNTWTVSVKNLKDGTTTHTKTRHVFIGAGGAAIKLLQMTGLPESKYYAGFPVGGLFLMTDNPEVVNAHTAKVYGRAELGAPPMSVPHIDTRYIDGKKYVLFGPFATYSNKFLKNGSQTDLMSSATKDNAVPMATAGLENLDLVKYLVSQVSLSDNQKLAELQKYYPEAKWEDWTEAQGGQRVQIIKTVPGEKTKLQFGTELFVSQDASVTALLGASPGASTSPYMMLDLLAKAFPAKVKGEWNNKLVQIIPSYGQDLAANPALLDQVRTETSRTLGLVYTSKTGTLPASKDGANVPAPTQFTPSPDAKKPVVVIEPDAQKPAA